MVQLKKENLPKYIETVDHQAFRVDAVCYDYLIVMSDRNEVLYYNYKEEKFYDADKILLELKPLTPQLYNGVTKYHLRRP